MRTPIHLLDGGLGTTLEASHNCHFTTSTPLWSSQLLIPSYQPTRISQTSGPEVLLAAQKAFVDAGADILLTATYSSSFEGFALSGFPIHEKEKKEEVEKMMRNAVFIAEEASFRSRARGADSDAAEKMGMGCSKGGIALSLGAYGAIMTPSQEYAGKYDGDHRSIEQLCAWHFERLKVFQKEVEGEENCWGRVDYVAFETVPLVVEVRGVRKCMWDCWVESENKKEKEEKREKKPFWITCVFPGLGKEKKDWEELSDGSSVEEVVEAMLGRREGEAIPFGIGINCTKITKLEKLISGFEEAVRGMCGRGEMGWEEWPALVVYPDGTRRDEVYNTATKVWEMKGGNEGLDSEGEEERWEESMLRIVRGVRERGLWREVLVGGCCKTTPREIGLLRNGIDQLEREPRD